MVGTTKKQNLAGFVVVALCGISLLGGVVSSKVHAYQSGSEIRAYLCDSQGPNVVVVTPESDSVTNEPSITLSGTAERTTQLNITLNGVFSHSVPIEPDTLFSTPITLAEGTNTITIEAYYSCNLTTTTTTVVVDYQPIETPSTGGSTDTTVSGGGGVVISSGGSKKRTSVSEIINNIEDKLTFNKPTQTDDNAISPTQSFMNSYVKPVINWIIFFAIFAALSLSVVPILLASKVTAMLGISHLNKYVRLNFIARFIAFVVAFILALILAS